MSRQRVSETRRVAKVQSSTFFTNEISSLEKSNTEKTSADDVDDDEDADADEDADEDADDNDDDDASMMEVSSTMTFNLMESALGSMGGMMGEMLAQSAAFRNFAGQTISRPSFSLDKFPANTARNKPKPRDDKRATRVNDDDDDDDDDDV